jgi:hypothetical protein
VADHAQLRRTDQRFMGDPYLRQLAVEIGRPEIEELDQLGELRRQIVVLPDEGLQQCRIVRQRISAVVRLKPASISEKWLSAFRCECAMGAPGQV